MCVCLSVCLSVRLFVCVEEGGEGSLFVLFHFFFFFIIMSFANQNLIKVTQRVKAAKTFSLCFTCRTDSVQRINALIVCSRCPWLPSLPNEKKATFRNTSQGLSGECLVVSSSLLAEDSHPSPGCLCERWDRCFHK